MTVITVTKGSQKEAIDAFLKTVSNNHERMNSLRAEANKELQELTAGTRDKYEKLMKETNDSNQAAHLAAVAEVRTALGLDPEVEFAVDDRYADQGYVFVSVETVGEEG
jgi:hypothetical protein